MATRRRRRDPDAAPLSAHALVVGAGIAGVAVAEALTSRGLDGVVLVDERAPLTLTSAVSTECYRDLWPDAAMVGLMTRSIDLLEEHATESDNAFHMNRRGYLFATADARRVDEWAITAARSATHGGGPLRTHPGPARDAYVPSSPQGLDRTMRGIDLITDRALITRRFPYLSREVVAVLHARRCGWLSAQRLGTYLLERAQARGARLIRGRVEGVEVRDGRVQAVRIAGERIAVPLVVIAAGPFTREVASLLGAELPISCEMHRKVTFHDTLGIVPRDAPFLVWSDPQRIPWSMTERRVLRDGGAGHLTDTTLPAGPHGRPEGRDSVVMLWGYDIAPAAPSWPLPIDRRYPEIVLRGWSRMLPGLRTYLARLPRPSVDGGYYARTPENRPLIGPFGPRGAYIVGALSGFGVMAACGAADLLARQICEEGLPTYVRAFLPDRYTDPAYLETMPQLAWGQL